MVANSVNYRNILCVFVYNTVDNVINILEKLLFFIFVDNITGKCKCIELIFVSLNSLTESAQSVSVLKIWESIIIPTRKSTLLSLSAHFPVITVSF